ELESSVSGKSVLAGDVLNGNSPGRERRVDGGRDFTPVFPTAEDGLVEGKSVLERRQSDPCASYLTRGQHNLNSIAMRRPGFAWEKSTRVFADRDLRRISEDNRPSGEP